jgi:MFS family permease
MVKDNYSPYRWVMMGTVCWAIASIYIVMITFSPILGTIAADLNVTMGAATNLMMGFVLAVAIFLMWGGLVADKYGITTALVLGLLCAFIPAVLQPAIGYSYGVVFISRLIEGASVGFIFACIGPVLALWFPLKERGIAGGLMIGSLSAGSAIGVVASPAILASTGSWQVTSAYLSIPAAVGIIMALAFTKKTPPAIPEMAATVSHAGRAMSFGEAFKMPITWLGSFILFFNAWNLYVLLNLVPGYLAHPIGVNLGEIVAGKVSLSVTLTGIVGMVVGGIIFDRVFKGYSKLSVMIGFAIGGIFTVLILASGVISNIALLVVVLLIAGFGIPFMNGAVSAHIAMTYPPQIVGRMVGWWFGFGTIGGALGLFLGGMLIDMTGSFMWSIMLAVLVCAVGFILGIWLKRPSM